MAKHQIPYDYVKLSTCRYCGGKGEEIAIHKQLKSIKGEVYQELPCTACKKLFDDGFLYFVGDCQHSGFVKKSACEQAFTPEAFAQLTGKIFRMEKCFQCLGMMAEE